MFTGFELLLVALAISLDTFAASLAMGTRPLGSHRILIATVFAIVGGLFPVVGMWIGALAAGPAEEVADIISVLVLAGLGGWLLNQARHEPGEGLPPPNPASRGLGLVLLAMGLSIDNLMVGVGLGLQVGAMTLLGVFTAGSVFVTTIVGLELGSRGYLQLGRWAEALAGLLLIGMAGGLLAGWI